MIDDAFRCSVKPLYSADLGTDIVADLLYSLVRMTRPQSLMEIGLGYTTPFLLKALKDNVQEICDDKIRVKEGSQSDLRLDVLRKETVNREYHPSLLAIDDMSDNDSTAHLVQEVVDDLQLNEWLEFHNGSFEGLTSKLGDKVFDFIWFDCGGPKEYCDFISEYWPRLCSDGGVLVLHYTYWHNSTISHRRNQTPLTADVLTPSPVLREIKRQHGLLGLDSHFEMTSLIEPHKSRQGSVTLLRKVSDKPIDVKESMTEELGGLGFSEPIKPFKL